MDISYVKNKILQINQDIEVIFTTLANIFPQLLTIKQDSSEFSIETIRASMKNLASSFDSGIHNEDNGLSSFLERSTQTFSQLNAEMKSLEAIHKRVEEIRWDSEELEIISLNAMVISIKSGEKGRAFSCITENLKRLSSQMIGLSDELLSYETKLIEKNTALQSSVSKVLELQAECASDNIAQPITAVVNVLHDAQNAIDSLSATSSSIISPIRLAMSGIQIQDIIRQSMDQLILIFNEIKDHSNSHGADEALDILTLNIRLYEVGLHILHDVKISLLNSLEIFMKNSNKFQEILAFVDSSRDQFISVYLDTNHTDKSFPYSLNQLMDNFSHYTNSVLEFQKGQKLMVIDTVSIVDGVKHLKKIFDTLVPVIVRLQHVRITQEIEVAKNPAINAVHDTVKFMSTLISNSEQRIEITRKELERFIVSIEKISSSYTRESEKLSDAILSISGKMNTFFAHLKKDGESLTTHVSAMHIYPEGFSSLCEQVAALLVSMEKNTATITDMYSHLEGEKSLLVQKRCEKLEQLGLSEWNIHNNQLRDLSQKFTITHHKVLAGSVGGFEVDSDKKGLPESGVTLFF